MNLKGRLAHIADKLDARRGYGKTTVLTKACKELDGVFLCSTHAEAKRVEREHGVTAKAMDLNLEGFSGPFFIDNHAVSDLLRRALHKINELETKVKALEDEVVVTHLDRG